MVEKHGGKDSKKVLGQAKSGPEPVAQQSTSDQVYWLGRQNANNNQHALTLSDAGLFE
jgi:hypothetical protein